MLVNVCGIMHILKWAVSMVWCLIVSLSGVLTFALDLFACTPEQLFQLLGLVIKREN